MKAIAFFWGGPMKDRAYYSLLKEKFPRKETVLTEIINLEAITHLPKGTEYFISDVHGEYGAIDYLLRNASGTIEQKVTECLGEDISKTELDQLCQLIYYPQAKLSRVSATLTEAQLDDFLLARISELLRIISYIGSKYTRSKIRKILPKSYAYVIEELLAENDQHNKTLYFQAITQKIQSFGQLSNLVIHLCDLIQNLALDRLHLVGDIFDRGKAPDLILDRLMGLRAVDIQWGNHDMVWMGAAAGSKVCLMNVIRVSARYHNLELLEDRYGINLRPLVDYSKKYYQPLPAFTPISDEGEIDEKTAQDMNVIQQATAILQFKLEEQLIQRRPEFQMADRRLLSKINYQDLTIQLGTTTYPLVDFNPVCIDPQQPWQLTQEEEQLLTHLMYSFQHASRLKAHMDFLFEKGAMYQISNQLLLLHGCMPLHPNGDLKSLVLGDEAYAGKALLDFYEKAVRQSYRQPQVDEDFETDLFWYLWVGEVSSLFGKQAMKTFERYYIEDKQVHHEAKNPYYALREEPRICRQILRSFGMDEKTGRIINGHTPIKEKSGESPIKADGLMIVIDGGFAKGYQKKTGNAGYTLVSNSYGLELIAHPPFQDIDHVLDGKCDIISRTRLVEKATERKLVGETDIGQNLKIQIQDLEYLYQYFEEI